MAGLYPGIMPPLIVPPAFMIPFLLKIYPGVAGYYFYADWFKKVPAAPPDLSFALFELPSPRGRV